MDSFDDAFKVGIAAARSVVQRKHEITAILNNFSESLKAQTDGQLAIEIREGSGLSEFLNGFTTSARMKPLGLYIYDTGKKSRAVQIAGWRQSEDGFPCWITTKGQEVACTNAAGLESELKRLARSPKMGAAVIDLLSKPMTGPT